MEKRKKLKLAANIDGLGWNFVGWQHPDMPADASENINFYIQQAKLAEAAKFDTLFLVDVSHVGPGQAATLEDVVKDVDAIIFALPFKAYKDLSKDLLQDVSEDVVIMDTANYYPARDGELPGIEGKTESEYISYILGRPVIKVFNNIMEYTFIHKGKAAGEEGRIAISVAGDNEEYKRVAAELVDQTGFNTVDGGSLAESWRQEPGTPAYCTELNAAVLKQALAAAEKGKAPALRDFVWDKGTNSKPSHEELLAMNRSAYAGRLF